MTSANVLQAIAASKAAKSNGVTNNSRRETVTGRTVPAYRAPIINSATQPLGPVATPAPQPTVLAKVIAAHVNQGKAEASADAKAEAQDTSGLREQVFTDPAYFEVYKTRCDELAAHFECGLSDLLILAIAALHEKAGLGDKRNAVPELNKSMVVVGDDLGLI